MPLIAEIKKNPGKPDQVFSCELLYHGGNRVVISYRSERPYRAAGLEIPPGTLTLGYYQEEWPYILWKMNGPDGALVGYYVHLCEDVRIGADTVEFRDMLLDIWFSPDGTGRLWDEDELEAARVSVLVDEAQATAVIEQARDLIRQFPAIRVWFDGLLEDIRKSA